MAFQIYNISGCSPDEHPLYFLDTNVWLAVLKHTGSQPLRAEEQQYVNFYEAIITLHNHPTKLQKKLRYLPSLVMTSMLLSEIINAYMRKVAMHSFYQARGSKASDYDFKLQFRPIPDYTRYLRSIIGDIQAHNDYLTFFDDQFTNIGPFNLLDELNKLSDRVDFNDLYYYQLAKKEGFTLVTHDSDFLLQDVPILTANKKLLQQVAVSR